MNKSKEKAIENKDYNKGYTEGYEDGKEETLKEYEKKIKALKNDIDILCGYKSLEEKKDKLKLKQKFIKK